MSSCNSRFLQSFFPPENVKIVNLQGRLKSNKKLASELSFDFCIGAVGKINSCLLCLLQSEWLKTETLEMLAIGLQNEVHMFMSHPQRDLFIFFLPADQLCAATNKGWVGGIALLQSDQSSYYCPFSGI